MSDCLGGEKKLKKNTIVGHLIEMPFEKRHQEHYDKTETSVFKKTSPTHSSLIKMSLNSVLFKTFHSVVQLDLIDLLFTDGYNHLSCPIVESKITVSEKTIVWCGQRKKYSTAQRCSLSIGQRFGLYCNFGRSINHMVF